MRRQIHPAPASQRGRVEGLSRLQASSTQAALEFHFPDQDQATLGERCEESRFYRFEKARQRGIRTAIEAFLRNSGERQDPFWVGPSVVRASEILRWSSGLPIANCSASARDCGVFSLIRFLDVLGNRNLGKRRDGSRAWVSQNPASQRTESSSFISWFHLCRVSLKVLIRSRMVGSDTFCLLNNWPEARLRAGPSGRPTAGIARTV